ncbi:DNA alkylation repair protein [Olivibacter sp. SDN3]|uniref:DNA alkylation repair protein n=1 Tax=Olivibacter sp. SDN3 TaxID=2764720 RepID=UPI001651A453|nr:DNA alkylation repair protein [Olivibacter sp. SDN3]QNL49871.1 DNA alkylation repair protein [Olivibacter sp. SDN3]
MALIKDIYTLNFFKELAVNLQQVLPAFDKTTFIDNIYANGFEEKEWKGRMQHVTEVLHQFMPVSYAEAVILLEKLILQLKTAGFGEDKLEFMFLPDYIATYGLDDFPASVYALERTTQFVSAEFAVRPFLIKYGVPMMDQMQEWSVHPNHKVRRFASEGTRPRLPWATAVPLLKQQPQLTLPILENLKHDPSLWVRKSVANHLNDIAKTHPAIVLDIARKWKGISKETDALVKHGCRTLLKQGNPEVLQLHGFDSTQVLLDNFVVNTPHVKGGESLSFTFSIKNNADKAQVIRLEYAVYYRRLRGDFSKKVFKISEKVYAPNEKVSVQRKQSFKPITTRKFYVGEHKVAVIVNGEEKAAGVFELLLPNQ